MLFMAGSSDLSISPVLAKRVWKSGFKPWHRKIKVSGRSNVHVKAELEKKGQLNLAPTL